MAKQIEIMRCETGAETYGILRTRVQSVQLGGRIREEAGPNNQFGVLPTTEGNLPAYRLADLLGMDADFPLELQRVLVLRSPWGLWCLIVDRIAQAELVNADQINLLPDIARAAYVDSVYANGDDVLLLLATDQLHPNADPLFDSADLAISTESVELKTVEADGKGHLVLFKMSGLHHGDRQVSIGLTPRQVDEVVRSADVQRVPAAPAYLRGVTNWRGQLIPVLDMAVRIGLIEESGALDPYDRVVVTHGRGTNKPVGFYASSDVDILELPAPHVSIDVPEQLDERLIMGAARYAGQTVLIPVVERLA